mgnify:CR=1 FL=1
MIKKLLIIFFLSPLLLISQENNQLKQKIDSLLNLPDDTVKVDEINKLIWKLTNDSLNCHLLAQKSIEISEKIGYLIGKATAQKNLAAYYYYSGKYDTALDLYNLSLENYQKAKNQKGIAISYRNIGNIYVQFGNWENALKNYFNSLKIREEIGDSAGVAIMYNAIGQLYQTINQNIDSSIVYYKRALNVFTKLNDNSNIASTLLNLGNIYNDLYTKNDKKNFLDTSLYYAFKALFYAKISKDSRIEGVCYELIGQNKIENKQLDSAFFYFQKSLEIRKKTNNVFGIVSSLYRIGIYYFRTNNYQKSEQYLQNSLKIASEQNIKALKKDILRSLSELYNTTKQYEKAYKTYIDYVDLKDSLENEKNTKQITQLSMQYEFDKQQKLKELEQQKKDAIKEAIIKRQRQINVLAFAALALAIITMFVIYRSYRQKKRTNKILEQKNEKILQQNEELNQKNEEILAQRDEIEAQKTELEQINKDITESINYAKRIQSAMLNISFFRENFQNFFILFRPRNIVSGDFFCGSKVNQKHIVVAADCTGHGVPGAFMSMLGISFLNQIVEQQFRFRDDFRASEILNRLRELIIQTLGSNSTSNEKREEEQEQLQDGMDMSLVIIDKQNKYLNFAGAYNSIYLVRNNELSIIKADRMPVGYHFAKLNNFFNDQFLELQISDKIYMFSDGYADQMGGNEGRKISQSVFKQQIIENSKLPFDDQKFMLEQFLDNWMMVYGAKQTDDILVIGFEIDE